MKKFQEPVKLSYASIRADHMLLEHLIGFPVNAAATIFFTQLFVLRLEQSGNTVAGNDS